MILINRYLCWFCIVFNFYFANVICIFIILCDLYIWFDMKIRILQWNIWFQEKADNIIEFIKDVNPDIVCLQELTIGSDFNDKKDVAKIIAEKLNLEYNFALAHSFPENDAGNGIFSKYPIVKNSNFHINQSKGSWDYSDEWRCCAISEIELEDHKKIIIGSVHASYNHKFEDTSDKQQEIKRLIDGIKNYDSRFVLTWDLNIVPNSKSINLIENYLNHCWPDYKYPTWTTKPFSYNGFEEDKLQWRVDYAFATRDIRVLNSEVLETNYSDHLPILLEIEV